MSTVSNFITTVICKNEGCMEYGLLEQTIRRSLTISESILVGILRDTCKFVVIDGKEKCSATSALSADSLIIAKTSLRVCKKQPGDCVSCEDLHLCKYLVCGSCKYGNKCKNSHDLDSAYNRAVCARHGLQDLGAAELFALLLQNDLSLLPEACSHYNRGNGEHGSCRFKGSCKGLHVCQHFLQGDCAFGDRCKRVHAFDGAAREILKRRGAGPERGADRLYKAYRNMFAIVGHADGPAAGRPTAAAAPAPAAAAAAAAAPPPPTRERSRQHSSPSAGEADSSEICLFFLRRHCSFKEKCIRVHYHLPYRWQISQRDGTTWKDLLDMEDVEQAYCNPANDASKGISQVDFLAMTSGAFEVRRLSTVSSVTKPPHFILTTDWLWYWKSDQGKWLEFGSEGDADGGSSITSQTLENIYLADTDGEIPFTAGSQQYLLSFKDMTQRNLKYNTKREVRRRPHFLSGKDVEKKLKSGTPEASGSSAASVPKHWDQEALADFEYKLTCLSATSTEFQQVQKLFKRTMPTSTVHSIQRIQNPSLHKVFQWQKEKMQKKNGGRPVDQRLLFHGTEQSLTKAICEQNLDWRICGIHGSHYGKGSYFARDASYSDRYSKSSGRTKTMFAVQVLVGEYARGDRSFLRPPQKPSDQGFYDSCVDSVVNPAIFVVFEKHQIYPEYIIEYGP
ncbi:protein mono-ADP-ribosyltransferase PARP12-like [Anguilla anguilla]|uniref:protein mono-ADP-ribosyltransferase PARP12-like n=1 Tax=Anguilla anguilla TaxID=7936 RepID=UPI0015B14055|nr:protein mono-ADP-ribosyltransferase PARP12-like [Anguilla anguilla]